VYLWVEKHATYPPILLIKMMPTASKQGALWGAAAQDWTDLQEPFNRPLWEAMLDAGNVGEATRFLDAGCGGGGASVLAARRGARLWGLDASDALIRIAARRLPEGDFRTGDLGALPYDDDAFDVTFASLSVMLAVDPLATLRELLRVTAPAGRMLVAIWGAREACEMGVVLKAIRETLPEPPQGKGPFVLSGPGHLEGLIEQAGGTVQGGAGVDCPFDYPDFEALWRAQRSAGPFQGAMQTVDEERLKEAVQRAVAPFRTSQGRLRLENRFRYVTARP